MKRYNFNRTVPDHRIPHDLHSSVHGAWSMSKIRQFKTLFVANFIRHMPVFICGVGTMVGYVMIEAWTLTQTTGDEDINKNRLFVASRYVRDYKTLGPYNTLFNCFKSDKNCGADYTE